MSPPNMSPAKFADDIFSEGLGSGENRSSATITRTRGGGTRDFASPSSIRKAKDTPNTDFEKPPVNTTMTDTVISTPRKKDGRVMSDKAVGTRERRDKKRPRIDSRSSFEPKADEGRPDRVLAPRSSGISLSSQRSYWDGDEYLGDIAAELDKQEKQFDTQPVTDNLAMDITGGSESGFSQSSSSMSSSTEATSNCSESSIFSKVSGPLDSLVATALKTTCQPGETVDINDSDNCEVVAYSRPQVSTTATPKARSIPRPVSSRTVVSYEKMAHPAPKPIAKSIKRTDNTMAGQRQSVIDLTHDSDEDAPSPAKLFTKDNIALDKPASAKSKITPRKGNGAHVASIVEKQTTSGTLNSEALMHNPVVLDTNLKPFVIAHDARAQALLDKYAIARGVQIEIARGVTQGWWDWDYVVEGKVKRLSGSNLEKAPMVAKIIDSGVQGDSMTPAVVASKNFAFAELDREHAARMEGRERGLGLMGPWHGVENWHGGRVQQVARLSEFDGRTGAMKITLEKFELGKTNRLTRFMGSVSVLQLRIKKELLTRQGDALVKALARRFVLCGRIFLPFHAKENKVYLVEINEDFERTPVPNLGDETRLSWDAFISWHNPLELNAKQPMSKWSTRWALTLSTSTPVVEFSPEHVYFMRDEYAEGQDQCTETMMTDGCGFINLAALVIIARTMRSVCPVVVQGRLAGAKGIWLLHPDHSHTDQNEPPMIWIRDSQYKVKLGDPCKWDRSHLILDLVRLPRLTIPSSLYMQTIVNMSHNGVKDAVFGDLLEAGLSAEIDPLTDWKSPHTGARLAKAIENAGGLMGARLARLAGAEARVFNYIRDEDKYGDLEDSDDGDGDKVLIERQGAGGLPSSLYESTRELLQAGFLPISTPIVREKIKYIVKLVIDQYMEQYHITVPQSAEAFIVPDPHGVLEEGQIYFRSSKPIGDSTTSADPYTFNGPVLVTRNPTRVASDVQKVMAVVHDKLLSYCDVIIFSTKGKRSLASYLGGGDYDGDTVTIIADPAIVDGFNHPPTIQEPSDLRDNFEREVEEVTAFMHRTSKLPTLRKEHELCMKLLLGLSDSKVGIYSQFHDNAVYSMGYNHKETIRLAYMFTTCLDSSKTGLRVKQDVFSKDSKTWNRPRPTCMQKIAESQLLLNSGHNTGPLTRDKKLGKFVLESLRSCAIRLKEDHLIRYESLCRSADGLADDTLLVPFREAEKRALLFKEKHNICLFQDQLSNMKKEIQNILDDYIMKLQEHHRTSPRKPRSGKTIPLADNSTSSGGSRQAIIRQFVTRFENIKYSNEIFSEAEFKEIKASCAYLIAGRRNGVLAPEFPFLMAHDALCAINARKEGVVSVTRDAAEFSTFSGKLLQVSVRDS